MAKSEGMTPDQYTIKEHRVKTKDGIYEIYVQEWGNPKGAPILFLHGGPGAGCRDRHKDSFDAKKHYVIFFDQRGAGNTTPKGSLKNNTTQHLIEDIELIRSKLNIEQFSINGGSWGSTLALIYAINHPGRVTSMLLSGIFLGTKSEIDWVDRGGFKDFFPEVWDFYIKDVPTNSLDNPGAYHRRQILDKNSKQSAYQYTEGEGAILQLDHRFKPSDYEEYDMTYATIFAQYLDNECFLSDSYIMKNIGKLTMPIYIVQGHYDMACLPRTAYELHKTLPDSKLYWSLAGHSGSDRSSYDMLKTIRDLIY